MKEMLGADYEAFIRAYDRPNTPALRINRNKYIVQSGEGGGTLLECIKGQVPWAEQGFYYDADSELRPGKHPYHDAGAYYIQEASAMITASLCPPRAQDKVLDLCAAPGGKTTQLAAYLGNTGLLVANEINPQRAVILSQNVERMGISNAVVTNHAPAELEKYFLDFFDKIVVDAPCSGEGMFRKEEQALTMWSQENVDLCAQRQKEILESAAKMLAAGGYLTYSTCTFAPEENEGVILSFLLSHPEFEVVETENPAVRKCLEDGVLDRGRAEWVSDSDKYSDQIAKTVRVFPHHADGEGHFAALLRKSPNAAAQVVKPKAKDKKKGSGVNSRDKDTSKLDPQKAYELYRQFIKNVTDQEIEGVPLVFGDQLYLCPKEMVADKDGMRILRCGLHLGNIIKGERFEPSHTLALALDVNEAKNVFSVNYDSARVYLHGDTLPCADESGWYLVTLDGFALGWGKASGGMMKNHYPKGLRKPL